MFAALSQGSPVYILDKASAPKIITGNVIGVSQPKFTGTQTLLDVKVDVGGTTRDFPSVPGSASVFSYNNGAVMISENQIGLENEIRGKLNHIDSFLDHIEDYKKDKAIYEELLTEVSPVFAKDSERDKRLATLSDKVLGMESKLDKVLELIGKEK